MLNVGLLTGACSTSAVQNNASVKTGNNRRLYVAGEISQSTIEFRCEARLIPDALIYMPVTLKVISNRKLCFSSESNILKKLFCVYLL
jgi:hypothetical protein